MTIDRHGDELSLLPMLSLVRLSLAPALFATALVAAPRVAGMASAQPQLSE